MSGTVKPRSGKAPLAPEPLGESDDRTTPDGPSPAAPLQAGPGEATLIYDQNKKRSSTETPRLLVVAGPRSGSEFQITEDETTVGRGSDNVVVIPDISVSRRHVTVQRQGESYLLIDQGSGNGTRVNGRQVERHPLQTGDEIAMGDTVVRFVEPGGVVVKTKSGRLAGAAAQAGIAAARARGGSASLGEDQPEITHAGTKGLKRRAPLYAAAIALLALVFVVGWARRNQRERVLADAARAGDESRALAQQRFEEGVKLLKEGRWVEARDKLKVAAELAPGDADIQRYLDRSDAEVPRVRAIVAARAALARQDFAGAKAALGGVPDDSGLAEQQHELAHQLRLAMDGAVREARIKAENGESAAAAELLDPVLGADPGRADALALKDALAGQKRAAAAAQRKDKPDRVERAEAAPAQVGPILEAYLAGDIGSAIERAEAGGDARAQRLARDLKAFDAAYREGLAKTQAKKIGDAINSLDQAEKLDRSLASGKEGRLGHEVRRALGNLHYTLGAQSLGADESLPQAALHLRAAVAADPANEQAQKQLAEVVARAKELFQRGYFEKDSEPDTARKAFRLVADTLPSSDETAQKAKRWLDKLDGKAPKEE